MALNKRGLSTFISKAVVASDAAEDLNRVQRAVAEALRFLMDSVETYVTETATTIVNNAITNISGGSSPIAFQLAAEKCENATRYMTDGFPPAGPLTTPFHVIMPRNGNITLFQIKLVTVAYPGSPPGSPSDYLEFTVQHTPGPAGATVDTTMYVKMTAALDGSTYALRFDNTHPFAVLKGDMISVKYKDFGLGTALGFMSATITLEPT